jgi:CRP-like cAMP-binding protein
VRLLEADPDLGRGLPREQARQATARLVARVVDLPRGAWRPRGRLNGAAAPIGLLVVDGLLVREASVGAHPSADLLGPGDLLRPWDDGEAELLLPRDLGWSALTPTRLAVIDRPLMMRASPWPDVLAALVQRSARRAERLVVLQAIAHLTRVDDRLLALFWALAERWGRVGPDGVVVALQLPHRTLAGMVGARRPSVTTALGQLMDRGLVERRAAGGWILRGKPPAAPVREAA